MERNLVPENLATAQKELADKIREIYQEITEEILQETKERLKSQIKAMADAELEHLFKGEKKTVFEERDQTGLDNRLIAYLYCLVQHPDQSSIDYDEIKGILGSTVFLVWEGQIAAVVSNVPIQEFYREDNRQHNQDQEWAVQRVQEHQNVLMCLMEPATILPVRFGTVFPDRKEVINFIRVERDKIVGGLQRVEGHQEWGVQVFTRTDFWEVEERKSRECQSVKNNIASPAQAYLWRNQRMNNGSADVKSKKRRYAQIFHDIIGEEAKDRQINKTKAQTGEISGEMILNGAYLVSKEKVEFFQGTIRKLEEEYQAKFSFQFSGPWPPYNFTLF